MKLGRKLVAILVALMAAMLLTSCLIAGYVVVAGFAQLEVHRLRLNVERAKAAIDLRMDQLVSTSADWAHWDDTYGFAQDANPAYVEANLQPQALRNLGLDVFAIARTDGRLLWSGVLTADGQVESMPEAVREAMGPGGALFSPASETAWISGLIPTPRGVMLTVSRPILTSQVTGPPTGLLVMGQLLNATEAGKLGRSLRMAIAFADPDRMARQDEHETAWLALRNGTPIAVQSRGWRTISGYMLLPDLTGAPALVLRVDMPRDIYLQGLRSYALLAGLILFTGLVFTAALVWFLHSIVLARIDSLRTQVGGVHLLEGRRPVPVALPGADELSTLAADVNQMVQREYESSYKILASEQQHAWLFSQMLVGFAVHELVCDETGAPRDYRFLRVNPAFERMTGLKAADVMGRTVLEVLPRTETFWIETYGKVVQTGNPVFFEQYSQAFDKHFEVSGFRTGPNQFAVMFTDITARKRSSERIRELLDESNRSRAALLSILEDAKRTHEALTESKASYRELFENMPSGYAHCRMLFRDGAPVDFEILSVNAATARITGLTGLAGRRVSEVLPMLGRNNPEVFEHLGRVATTGEPKAFETFVPELGIWFSIVAHCPRPEEFVAMFNDITERKKLEAQVLRTQRLESVGRLASGIAHDLNNILTPVLMAPPLLREAIQDPAALSLVDSVEASAHRGAAIIKQLLLFGRGTGGQRTAVSLRGVTRDMMKFIEETFPKNIRAEATLPADLALVSGDPTQLHQVLMNLCVNARDAMPDGGSLHIVLRSVEVTPAMAAANPGARTGPHIEWVVSDSGNGIEGSHLDKIFDPFFTTKPPGEGTGLGLSTSLAIVRAHEGFIQVESLPDQGTTFRVFLPALNAPLPQPADSAPSAVPRGHGECILVVDDEEQVRTITCRILDRNGYRCVCAADGAAALDQLERRGESVRVVVTDLMMPGIDGAELIRRIRTFHPDLPIIAMSGVFTSIDPMVKKHARLFLQKPCDPQQVLTGLRQALGAS